MNAGIEAVKIVEEKKEAFIPNSSNFISNANNESNVNHTYFSESVVSNSHKSERKTSIPSHEPEKNITMQSVSNAPELSVLKQSEQFVPTSSSDQIIPTSNLSLHESCDGAATPVANSIEVGRSIQDNGDDVDNDENSEENDEDENDDDEDDESMSSESDDSDSDLYEEKTSDVEINDGNTAADSEMRTELSSVVPPTSISLEITPSHETDTALPDVHEEIQNRDNEAKANVDQCTAELVKNINVIDNKNQAMEKNQAPETVSLSDDRFIKPITFETAATMDDVSDTELESYLQELEDLEEPNPMLTKIKGDTVKSAINSVKSDDIDPYENENVDQTIENVGDINQSQELINQIASKDDRNADSFSQASTVEFGDVNATTSSNEQVPNAVYSNQPNESGQSINSVLDGEQIDDIEIDVQPNSQIDVQTINPPNECASELDDSCRERELSSDLENHVDCSECELDQQTGNVAKRPNSLNLQNCNSTLIDQPQQQQPQDSSSSVNFTNDGNAGSTPAACGQFLSSSISSDDSNIVNDNNQMIVSRLIQFI